MAKVKHVGFKGAVKAVEKEGYSKKTAAKIIGAGKAHASTAAKKRNPRLKKTGKGKC
jgi:transposase